MREGRSFPAEVGLLSLELTQPKPSGLLAAAVALVVMCDPQATASDYEGMRPSNGR